MVIRDRVAMARAATVTLVVCDNDGVLTDGTVLVSARGEEMKAYSLRDGMAVERLRQADIETAIVTREVSEIVRRRAEKLGIRHVWTGVADKRAFLARIVEETGRSLAQIAYIGDDVNDLGIIAAVADAGLTASPGDGMPEVHAVVHLICSAPGGRGALRELADWILTHRDPQPERRRS